MKEKKKLPKGCIWLVLAIAGLFIYFIFSAKLDDEKRTEYVKGAWTSLNYDQKETWIKDYLNNPDDNGFVMITQMKNAVKNKFNYPDEVEFNLGESPGFVNADIIDAETGTVFSRGSGTAKNAFGVKQGFSYSIRLKVTKDSLYIAEVSVNPK